MDEASRELIVQQGSVEQFWHQRKIIMQESLPEPVDILFVELYPFGRKKFTREIQQLIGYCRQRNSNLKVICSVRDILVEKDRWEERQDRIIEVIQEHFDVVLVHTDPQLVPFDLTFQKASQIEDKIVYTGYVTENQKVPTKNRRPKVLVSRGGRQGGDFLVEACLDAAVLIPEVTMTFIRSPKMTKSLLDKMESTTASNVEIIDFTKEFEKQLCESQLSISLGGYNTMMNLLRTKTFGLVWPFEKSSEQELRAQILQDHNVLKVLTKNDLQVSKLACLIRGSLNNSDWDHIDLDLDGSAFVNHWLHQLF